MICRPRGRRSDLPPEVIKETILEKAKAHFSQHGFQGANLKDIAKDAGVANSLINYHFKDKENLYRVCCENYARGGIETIKRVLAEPKTRDEMKVRLELFVEEMMLSILKDPDGFAIIDREMRSGNAMILKLFQETMLPAYLTVVQFFVQAAENGLLKEGLDPTILAGLLFTMTCDTARKDFLSKKFLNFSLEQSDYRKRFTEHIVSMYLNGVVK